MKISFEVGLDTNYNVDFVFDSFSGTIKLIVDGEIELKTTMIMGGKKMYSCMAGEQKVDVEVIQPLFLALFRKRSYKVYLNGDIYKTFDSKGRLIEKIKS